ncbi:flavin monoamine oxidase family protein [Methylobacterium persicinum]|uniref:Tryptophan 2-monooxygenase n=1 Tax=Methylobacterium persicinum TaxID=374426 RepID=A0ABU0HK26_9HYPH|nr:FAD-dependent oxidoreductase [Methylobacterium persicinum]MDQ0442075.1 monoamine oxidase [Methylobacterium persicinum]GJE38826.1 Pseudooxynicotine oxidase [Methylobacterium persicinum]
MITRRTALATGLFVAMPALLRAQPGPVAIVGAGAAGLAAAEILRQAHHPFVLLEARDRIGGRAHTDRSLGQGIPFDAGAQYIHWAERNPWSAIARETGATYTDQDGWARTLFIDGRPATEAERAHRRAGFTGLDAILAPKGADASLAAEAKVAGSDAETATSGLSRLSLGEDPDRVSAADYDRLWSGTDLWVDGYGDLVARHFAHLPVKLNCPVLSIDWSGPGIRLQTEQGTVEASAAIVTVPVGLLKDGSLAFRPNLPDASRTALAGLSMGAYTKIALRLDPAKVDARAFGDAVSVVRDGPTIYFEMGPFGHPIAVANLGGDLARDVCRTGEAAAVALATERLGAILGNHAAGAVTGGRLAAWWTDPHARGSYSIAAPGHADARIALRQPVGDRLFFAGEALAGGGAMTVGGATLDGERAAREVLKRFPA